MDKIANLNYRILEEVNTMLINGQPITQKLQHEEVYCGNCNRLLFKFAPEDLLQSRRSYLENVGKKDLVYCPSCGSKLNYAIDIIDYKEVKEKDDQ